MLRRFVFYMYQRSTCISYFVCVTKISGFFFSICTSTTLETCCLEPTRSSVRCWLKSWRPQQQQRKRWASTCRVCVMLLVQHSCLTPPRSQPIQWPSDIIAQVSNNGIESSDQSQSSGHLCCLTALFNLFFSSYTRTNSWNVRLQNCKI